MAKYSVDYFETYRGHYEVEAEDELEAEDKIRNSIAEGKLKEPDVCEDSWCEVEPIKTKFITRVTEKYTRYIEIEAVDKDEALELMQNKLANGEIDIACDGGSYDYDDKVVVMQEVI